MIWYSEAQVSWRMTLMNKLIILFSDLNLFHRNCSYWSDLSEYKNIFFLEFLSFQPHHFIHLFMRRIAQKTLVALTWREYQGYGFLGFGLDYYLL